MCVGGRVSRGLAVGKGGGVARRNAAGVQVLVMHLFFLLGVSEEIPGGCTFFVSQARCRDAP